MLRRKDCCVLTPGAQLDLSPCASRHVHATTLLNLRAVSTVRSLSVRKKTCSCDNTAAFARCEHTWISHRAQRDMFRRKNCCVLTPGAQLDLSPCARRPVHATTLLRSHAVSTFGSRSVRKETCSGDKIAAVSRGEHSWISHRAQRDMFRRKTAVFSRREHSWISLRAQGDMFRQNDCCARSVRKERRSIEKTAAISRCPPR